MQTGVVISRFLIRIPSSTELEERQCIFLRGDHSPYDGRQEKGIYEVLTLLHIARLMIMLIMLLLKIYMLMQDLLLLKGCTKK
jgi:hypothetical protein